MGENTVSLRYRLRGNNQLAKGQREKDRTWLSYALICDYDLQCAQEVTEMSYFRPELIMEICRELLFPGPKRKREKMSDKRVRIIDIAEELGLSTATVSNVIHGKTKKISDETVKRVQELLEKKQYIPSMAGILLAQNDSKIIGVVVNNHEKYESHALEDNFISASLNYLSTEIEKAGFFMMVKVTREWKEISRFASMWNMEGLVIMGFCEQDYKKLRESMHIPFVVYDGYFKHPGRICNIIVDNYDGGLQTGRYFYKMGHRKVLCISDNDICMDHERWEGFCAGMEETERKKGEKKKIGIGRNCIEDAGADFLLIPSQKEERFLLYEKEIKMFLKYTAVFAVSDYYALELMHFLQERGIRIPEDISISGFDGSPICEQVYPSLTTVAQDGRERAKLAIQALKDMKQGVGEGSVKILPVTLIERNSVKRILSKQTNFQRYFCNGLRV